MLGALCKTLASRMQVPMIGERRDRCEFNIAYEG